MPDITMCLNDDCPLKDKCYRHTAIPKEYWQSYANFEYVVKDGEVICEDYYERE